MPDFCDILLQTYDQVTKAFDCRLKTLLLVGVKLSLTYLFEPLLPLEDQLLKLKGLGGNINLLLFPVKQEKRLERSRCVHNPEFVLALVSTFTMW